MSNRSSRSLLMGLGAVVIALAVSASRAGTIVDFKPGPTSPGLFEFDWLISAPGLSETVGATSNGDGALPPALQTAPGLDVETPFIIPAVPGSSINAGAGSTLFYDCTLDLTGFGPGGGLIVVGPGVFVQPLAPGSFSITSTTGIPLLTGVVGPSTISGQLGGTAGATFSANNVTYTGGLIFTALTTSGGTVAGNDLAFSFVDATPPFTPGAVLTPFAANATGLFSADVIPEPASLGLLALAGLALRRRRA